MIDRSWLVQELRGLKPRWFYDIKLFSVKDLNILLHNSQEINAERWEVNPFSENDQFMINGTK